MAKWFLLNAVTLTMTIGQPEKLLPGKTIDDTIIPLATLASVGGQVWPVADTKVSAAAAVVAAAQKNKGIDEQDSANLMFAAALASSQAQAVQTQHFTLTTAQIQALTSGTAFNVGAPLPTGAVLHGYSASWVAVTGGTLSGVALVIGDATTANDILTSTSVFTTGKTSAGDYQPRSGAQIQATLTATGDTLADATAGSLTIDLFYSVPSVAA